jgi:flagellar hook-associated protein 2
VMKRNGAAYTLQAGEYFKDGEFYKDVTVDGVTTTTKITDITLEDAEGNAIADNAKLVQVGNQMKVFTGTAAKVEVSQNTDQIMDGIKGFMDEYNKLIKTINDYLDEDTSYRDYAPLTADQKKEMSEREIELWEEKAKEGLLHRDSTLQTFLQQMRTVLYEKPANGGYALYELGIETGAWETKGQLTFTTDGEARLRQLLETDPTNVMKLFTDPEDGLGTKLNTILKSTANTTGGSPGTLVQLAGVKGGSTEKNNSIYDQLKSLDEKIAALKRTYEAEKTRYWNQFNTMEQMISNMNAQSSYLAQMMGG